MKRLGHRLGYTAGHGTGSAEPNKYRGSSAILIRMASGASVLLDAGEGAAGALVRRFGLQGCRSRIASTSFNALQKLRSNDVRAVQLLKAFTSLSIVQPLMV